jgi:16S rRNA (cytosine1402-N4)-methyltransferase
VGALSHQPVLLAPTIELLAPRPGGVYVDATLGAGGHAAAVLERSGPDGRLLGVDRDPRALGLAAERLRAFGPRVRLAHGRMSELPAILAREGLSSVDGLLVDLGVSSMQLDDPGRGFSFQADGPLDMRMDPVRDEPLAALLPRLSEDELARALADLGEVPRARQAARRIRAALAEGRLGGTRELARALGEGARAGARIHPATRAFMALRLLVNDELGELDSLLASLPAPLAVGGRVVVLSFHSLEDRRVKQRLLELEGRCVCPAGLPVCRCGVQTRMRRLTRRALRAEQAEIEQNPRARSVRLRAAERLAA